MDFSKLDQTRSARIAEAFRDWKNFPSARFYSLGSRRTLERGLRYFEEERLTDLSFHEGRKRFGSVVRGSQDYQTTAGVDGTTLECSCTCPAFEGGLGACKHIVALVAFLYWITQDRLFGGAPMRNQTGVALLEDLLTTARSPKVPEKEAPEPSDCDEAEDESEAEPPLALSAAVSSDALESVQRIVFSRENTWSLQFRLISPPPMRKIPRFGPQFRDFQFGRPVKIRDHEFGTAMKRLLPLAETAGIPVILESVRNGLVKLSGTFHSQVAEVRVDSSPAENKVEAFREIQDPPARNLGTVTSEWCILENGDLFHLSGAPSTPLTRMASPHAIAEPWAETINVIEGRQSRATATTLERFNSLSLALPFEPQSFLPKQVHLSLRGERAEIPEPSRTAPVDLTLAVEAATPEDEVPDHVAAICRLHFNADDAPLPVEKTLMDWLLFDISAYKIDPALNGAMSRRKLFLETVRDLSLIEDRKERAEIIRDFAGNDCFSRLRLHHKAKRWINLIEKGWLATERQTHLIASPSEGWTLARSPRRKFIQVLFGMLEIEEAARTMAIAPERRLRSEAIVPFLKRAALLCSVTGARLHYDRKPVEAAPVSISLEANQNRDIDWFELKAEVTCRTITIPMEQWELLIRGELLIEHESNFLIPQLPEGEAILALRELFGTSRRRHDGGSFEEKGSALVPRLQMLDWIELRKQGVSLKLPPEVEASFESLANFSSLPSEAVPRSVKATLRDYQKSGYNWLRFLYEHRFGACLADDMGLGKTLQAIALLAWRQRDRNKSSPPHLIVLPPSLLYNWSSEIARFCPALRVAEYHGPDRDLPAVAKSDAILTTYEVLRRDIAELEQTRFDIVIFDETQNLKNIAGDRTKAALRLNRRFTLCLTGTPMENHVGEYYSILNLALGGIFGDYQEFRRKLREGETLLLRRARPFVLRRTKDEILKELPPKVETETHLEMTEEQKEIYTRTVWEVKEEVNEAYALKTKSQAGIVALAALTRLRQVCISPELLAKPLKKPAPKLRFILDQMRELVDEGSSALIFSQFVRTFDLLEPAARKEGIPLLRLDGSTPTARRKKLVEEFQNAKEPRMFLISLKAGGVGLNLTRAQYVFHIDPWWNPAVENQASDRAHRIGQEKTVFVQRLLMRHTVEEKIMELKRRKQKVFDAIMSGNAKPDSGSAISREDLQFLLG